MSLFCHRELYKRTNSIEVEKYNEWHFKRRQNLVWKRLLSFEARLHHDEHSSNTYTLATQYFNTNCYFYNNFALLTKRRQSLNWTKWFDKGKSTQWQTFTHRNDSGKKRLYSLATIWFLVIIFVSSLPRSFTWSTTPMVKLHKLTGSVIKWSFGWLQNTTSRMHNWWMILVILNNPAICCKLNFISYTFVEPSDRLFGSFVNGSWNGMIRQILNGVSIFY